MDHSGLYVSLEWQGRVSLAPIKTKTFGKKYHSAMVFVADGHEDGLCVAVASLMCVAGITAALLVSRLIYRCD